MAAGDVTITAANKTIYLGRVKATELNGGDFSSPEKKDREIADLIQQLVESVTVT